MFKLIKYEFRKTRTAFSILLAVIAALQVYYMISINGSSENNIAISALLLFFAALATAAVVFILGITAYSGELKTKTSYLIFLTPNTTLGVITAKMLFTILAAILFSALLGGLCLYDLSRLFEKYSGYTDLAGNLKDIIEQYAGIDITNLWFQLGFSLLTMMLNIVRALVTAYLAITFSATIMQNRKGKGLVTFLIYAAIVYGAGALSSAIGGATIITDTGSLIRAMLPSIAISLALILISLFGSAWLLEKKVSL